MPDERDPRLLITGYLLFVVAGSLLFMALVMDDAQSVVPFGAALGAIYLGLKFIEHPMPEGAEPDEEGDLD